MGTFLEEGEVELEVEVGDKQVGVAGRLLGGPEEVEMGVSQVCAWISSVSKVQL